MRPVGTAEGGNTTFEEWIATRTITEKTVIKLSGHSLGGTYVFGRTVCTVTASQLANVFSCTWLIP
jgi:hypothetical protein